MKIGVFTVLFSQRPLEETLDYVKAAGCEAVEIGVGERTLARRTRTPRCWWRTRASARPSSMRATSRGLEISALSCHGSRLHPKADIAQAHDRDYRNAVRLAEQIGVDTVITFSGSPSRAAARSRWSRTG